MIEVEFDAKALEDGLNRLFRKLDDTSDFMSESAETLFARTKGRIEAVVRRLTEQPGPPNPLLPSSNISGAAEAPITAP